MEIQTNGFAPIILGALRNGKVVNPKGIDRSATYNADLVALFQAHPTQTVTFETVELLDLQSKASYNSTGESYANGNFAAKAICHIKVGGQSYKVKIHLCDLVNIADGQAICTLQSGEMDGRGSEKIQWMVLQNTNRATEAETLAWAEKAFANANVIPAIVGE
jgi:hypothetical protein